MTKQCPICGTEINSQEEVCPECGYSFKEGPSETLNEKVTDTSNFLNKEQNENIEWSELKDMSIGHVMTMFNEQQTEEKAEPSVVPEVKQGKESDDETSVVPGKKIDELADTAALDQYINAHKDDKQVTKEPMQKEIDKDTEIDSLAPSSEQSKANNKGQDEVKSDETDNKLTDSIDEESEQMRKDLPKEELTKFIKPENREEIRPIGPKALPSNSTSIPSKSKKPEEIEMDAAPIFFKDPEDVKKTKDQFEKPTKIDTVQKELENEPANLPSSKNYKKMALILAAVVVLSGGSWFVYNQTQNKSTDEEQVAQKQDKLVTQTEKELNSYFTDDKQLFLKPEMVSVSTKTIKENLDTLKEDSNYKNLVATYKKVTDKQTAISKVNELFAQPIIDGNKLKDVAIKADKKVDLAKREEKNDFDRLLNQATDQAASQYEQLQKAKTAVDIFYKNNELTDALTRENYQAAKTEVDKVKSEELRKPLNEALLKADKSLTDAEAALASSQQAVSDQTTIDPATSSVYQGNNTQAANGVQPDSDTFSAPNAQGVYTAPVYSVDPNDVSDMSNPAWSWALGVQEKVIATCIERGYIKAGAYSLQPARIINGEGYYNLYGADNQYLVTINAKTGWFKGNASRNAGR